MSAMKSIGCGHAAAYSKGQSLLKQIRWQPVPTAMLKLPSVAKGSALRARCDAESQKTGRPVVEIIGCVQFAARIEHLASIGGEDLRPVLLDGSRLTPDQIARLCRRMPPFIEEKLKEFREGPVSIDANPNGVFDTNGWCELRTRLPKFRSTLQHYAANCETGHGCLAPDQFEPCHRILTEICSECDVLSTVVRNCTPVGEGNGRKAKLLSVREVSWSNARTRFAQVLGVLQKTNRDLKSPHWKEEWVPTVADYQAISSDVAAMKSAVQCILVAPGGGALTVQAECLLPHYNSLQGHFCFNTGPPSDAERIEIESAAAVEYVHRLCARSFTKKQRSKVALKSSFETPCKRSSERA